MLGAGFWAPGGAGKSPPGGAPDFGGPGGDPGKGRLRTTLLIGASCMAPPCEKTLCLTTLGVGWPGVGLVFRGPGGETHPHCSASVVILAQVRIAWLECALAGGWPETPLPIHAGRRFCRRSGESGGVFGSVAHPVAAPHRATGCSVPVRWCRSFISLAAAGCCS
jgi:hypothetical protein